MEKLFYLRSRHGNCGDNVVFHNKNGAGYGTDLDGLHVFTREEAQKELGYDIRSLPLLKSEVDKQSIKAVDCQCLDVLKGFEDPNDQYVIQIKGLWNGNDIAFAVMGGHSFDYNQAAIFKFDETKVLTTQARTIWSKEYLDGLCRRTFQEENISTRKMITGPGIKYKKPRPSRATGKVRWNCPSCGKINWQYNPYDFESCTSFKCDLF